MVSTIVADGLTVTEAGSKCKPLSIHPVSAAAGHAMDKLQYLGKNGHIQTDDIITWGLATCHNVSQSDLGFVGNQVEVKMFATTGWNLIEASGQPTRVSHPVNAGQQLTIVRVNEFEHAKRSMSVVALDESTGELHVFCKVRPLHGVHTMGLCCSPTTCAELPPSVSPR